MKKNKKTAVIALTSLALIAGGTATVLDFFGQSTGTVDVESEAVNYSGTTDASYAGNAAPATDYNMVTLVNNNDDRFVDVNWTTTTNDDFSSSPEAFRSVYAVQNFFLVESDNPDSGSETAYSVEVIPNVDEVTYNVSLPENYFADKTSANADLQISPENSGSTDNYHVKYSSDSHTSDGDYNWMLYNPSVSKTETIKGKSNVLATEKVRSVEASESGSYMEVTVKRGIDTAQSFGVSATAGGEDTSYSTEGFAYNDQSVTGQKPVDFTDYLGQDTVTLEPSGEHQFNAGVFLDSDTPSSDSYELAVEAEPVTAR